MFLRRAASVVVLAVVGSGLAIAPPVAAVTASPAVISVDCGITGGATSTTITGRVGDTMTITNTSASGTCAFAGYSGVVTATNLTSGTTLGTRSSSLVTIVTAGAFTITPSVGGTAGTFTVVIGDPNPAPEYTITFDANGGSCSSNPLVLTVASNDWYALPTDGTDAYQCHRDDYTLIGWSRGSTLIQPGGANRAPDLPLQETTTHAKAADHTTLHAVWKPKGVEITYDANVASADRCQDATGVLLAVGDRTSESTVFYAGSSDTIAMQAPCTPIDGLGVALPLKGWAIRGDGPPVIKPGEPLSDVPFSAGSIKTLYAVWGADESGPRVPQWMLNDQATILYSVEEERLVLTFMMRNPADAGWMGLTFNEFMFPGDSIVVSWDGSGAQSAFALDSYNPGIPTLPNFPAPLQDTNPRLKLTGDPLDNRDNVTLTGASDTNGTLVITVERDLQTGDIFDFQMTDDDRFNVVAAYGLGQTWNRSYDAQQPGHTFYAADIWELGN